jgi:hypothetical protein
MFKYKDMVVCVNKKISYASNDGRTTGLTIGKKYEVVSTKHHMVSIINDYNMVAQYYDYRFVTLEEHRKQKLEKLQSNIMRSQKPHPFSSLSDDTLYSPLSQLDTP